jgi:hypothetical protein
MCRTAKSDSFYEMCKCIFTGDPFSSWNVEKLLDLVESVGVDALGLADVDSGHLGHVEDALAAVARVDVVLSNK